VHSGDVGAVIVPLSTAVWLSAAACWGCWYSKAQESDLSVPCLINAAKGKEFMKSRSFKGHADTIKSPIPQNKDINARNIRGQTPLHLASAENNNDAVKLLLESGAEVDAVATNSGCTSLHYAASLGHVDLCESLIRYGADTDSQTARLGTPLHLAIARGYPEVVTLLLKYRARLDIRNKNGMTPLQQAENAGNSEIVALIKRYLSESWPYLLISHH
jgi:ankyrin repeat protein